MHGDPPRQWRGFARNAEFAGTGPKLTGLQHDRASWVGPVASARAFRRAWQSPGRDFGGVLVDTPHPFDVPATVCAKPDPAIFQHAAAVLGFDSACARGIEDGQAEVAAIECAGVVVLSVGDARKSREADAVLPVWLRSIRSDPSHRPDREYHRG